jgi:hypothetical protein
MQFKTGDSIDSDHCIALTHEMFRCHDEFQRFTHYATVMIMKGRTRELSYRAYNAYSGFIHHLYEFILGCKARDSRNTNITNKKGEDRTLIIDHYVLHHAQRIMNQYRDTIKDGRAPDWVNDISYYDVTVPTDFAKDFREYRNKVCGHVAYERTSKLSLTQFYDKYHKYLYYLYRDSLAWWGPKDDQFPDLKEITEFCVWIEDQNA